jgi:hypothetical protein
MGTKWVTLTVGILGKSENEKSPNSLRIEAFPSGADETRTRDLLRDSKKYFLVFNPKSKFSPSLHTKSLPQRKAIWYEKIFNPQQKISLLADTN